MSIKSPVVTATTPNPGSETGAGLLYSPESVELIDLVKSTTAKYLGIMAAARARSEHRTVVTPGDVLESVTEALGSIIEDTRKVEKESHP